MSCYEYIYVTEVKEGKIMILRMEGNLPDDLQLLSRLRGIRNDDRNRIKRLAES